MPHTVDVLVAARVLLDVRIRACHVGLGLVVVVVAHEVLDGVVGQEAAELGAQLRGKGLVGAEHQDGSLQLLYGPGHHVGLPASGHAGEDLLGQARADALDELGDGLRLVTGRLEGGVDTKAGGHGHC